MFPHLNQLMQLQELILILEEQKAVGHTAHLESLQESIKTMAKQVPADVRTTFEKLRKKDNNIVVPIANEICSGCGMKLPRSLIQVVKAGKAITCCPNCTRILYLPEVSARNTRRRPGRFETIKPGISRFSAKSLMVPKLSGNTQDEAIEELAALMASEGFVDRGDLLREAALRRESVLSTAVGHGLAFPHARGIEGGGLTLAVGINLDGIQFDNHGNEPVKLVFFMAIPTIASVFYLKLLAGLTAAFRTAPARNELLSTTNQESMWKALIKTTRKTVK